MGLYMSCQYRQQGLSEEGKAFSDGWGRKIDARNFSSSGKNHKMVTRKRLKMSG